MSNALEDREYWYDYEQGHDSYLLGDSFDDREALGWQQGWKDAELEWRDK